MEERRSKDEVKTETLKNSTVNLIKENKPREFNNTVVEVKGNITFPSTTTEYPHVVHVPIKKRKKGNRRKDHLKNKKLERKHDVELKDGVSNDRWLKFVQSKKRTRDRRDEEVDDDNGWPPPDEWLQPVRFRHGRQDSLWSETEEKNWMEEPVKDKLTWIPTNGNNEIDRETQNKAVLQETTETSSNWQKKGNGSWPESARSRAEFSYHRVTANPRERHKATAFVAVSVVKNRAPPPPHKPHPPPWSHARHLHRLQEQLRSLSAAKARLRHHWFEKERLHQSLLSPDKQNEVSES